MDKQALISIMHSKRVNMYLLEKCKVECRNGIVVFLSENKEYKNIPIANTTFILLSNGTSITQKAMQKLAEAEVIVGWCGTNCSKFTNGIPIEWVTPNGYKATEYVQKYLKNWYNEESNLKMAKYLMQYRLDFFIKVWDGNERLEEYGLYVDSLEMDNTINTFKKGIEKSIKKEELLGYEGDFVKSIYNYLSTELNINFTRNTESKDDVNKFLNIGYNFTYGLAASTLWTLGIPYAFPLIHGNTVKGALVFDIADIVKTAIIPHLAFISVYNKEDLKIFKENCQKELIKLKIMDSMYECVENICEI